MIKSMDHFALGVSDMERSLGFYRDVFGMEVVADLDLSDGSIGKIIGTEGAKCRIVHLKLGQAVLELFQYSQPVGENKASQMQQFDHGLIHIGFSVDNFHEHVAQLKEMGVEFLGEPVEFQPGVWVLYFRGPDGEVCEFMQAPE